LELNDRKTAVTSNFFWRLAERVGAQGVKFLVELILARILLPDDYGAIALVTVFITILNVFVDSGLGNALIQKKDADDLDFSSVFWFNLILSVVLYILLFMSGPFIAAYYKRPELNPVIRVLGIQVIIAGIKNVQQAFISRTMQFKRFFYATLGGTIGAALLGIVMAFYGCGVWALVGQQLFNVFVDTVILWITVKWRPHFRFSFERIRILFSFGSKLLASALLETAYTEIWQLLIGKRYTSSSLAFFNRGKQLPHLFVNNINSSIDSVLLPVMSSAQDNVNSVRAMTRRSIQVSTFIMAPLMIGLALTGEVLIRLLLTEKWLPAVPYLRIYCIIYLFYPIHTANLNAIKALGRSDLFLKLEILKKIAGIIILIKTIFISPLAVAYGMLAVSILSQIINSYPNRKLLNYGYADQVKDILPSVLLAIIMGFAVKLIDLLSLNEISSLVLKVINGTSVYLGCAILLKIESFSFICEIAKKFYNK